MDLPRSSTRTTVLKTRTRGCCCFGWSSHNLYQDKVLRVAHQARSIRFVLAVAVAVATMVPRPFLPLSMAPLPQPLSQPVSTMGVTTTTLMPVSVSVAAATVVLVDPVSTGVMLQQRLFRAGYRIILVWSDRTSPIVRQQHYTKSGCSPQDFAAIIVHRPCDDLGGGIKETITGILEACGSSDVSTSKGIVTAVCCGSEYGVLLEDEIATELNKVLETTHLKPSGMALTQTKVDKHAQASRIRKAGLDAVREELAFEDEDVASFLNAYHAHGDHNKTTPLAVVVKPQTGAGSVGVMFCRSEQAVWDGFHAILAGEHKANYGKRYKHYKHAGVLLQEYLNGTEYIVNMVVMDGVIKTTATWKYDKRPYNTASFVCFSKELVVLSDDDEPHLKDIVEYAENVTRALDFTNGALHAEVMYVEGRGPVLVEMNCRLHGGNGAWVHPAEICMGYSQLNVYMDAYLNEGKADFATVPARPLMAHKRCHQVKMRSHIGGTLQGYIPEQMDRIKTLPSYYEHFFNVHPGDTLLETIDMPSVPGEVTLIHEDRVQLDKDYQQLNEILREGIFQVA